MENIDLKKLEVAIKYIERMADGRNPVNNQEIGEDSVINDPNVVRCFFYVSDILKSVYNKERKKSIHKEKFPFELLNNYKYVNDKSISHIMQQINELVNDENVEKINYSKATKWLKEHGYLQEEQSQELEKKITMPTQKGKDIGIYSERRESMGGNVYYVVMYNEQAQYFLIANLAEMYKKEN